MDIDQARASFARGELAEAILEPADQGNGWMVVLREHAGSRAVLTDHSGLEKVYHTLEHATDVAKSLGFATVRVEEPI
mgnify:CR=1 FL=1